MSSQNSAIHILVVDDNEMNRDMLSRRLRRQGYKVDVAEDGERALSSMKETLYHLVLLDIMMPGLNGYQVLEQAKSDVQLRSIPVIMISAVDDLDSVVRCIELGADDYLFKPFNPVLLKARVSATLKKHDARTLLSETTLNQAHGISHALVDDIDKLIQSNTVKEEGMEIVQKLRKNAEGLLKLIHNN